MRKFSPAKPGIILGSIFLFGVIALFGVRAWLLSYIKSDGFRQKVSASINRVFKADGTLMPLQYAGGIFYSDGFAGSGNGGAFFSEMRADEIRAVVNWRGLFRRRYEIDELTVQRLNMRFANARPESAAAPSRMEPDQIKTEEGWKLGLQKLTISESNWNWETPDGIKGSVRGSSLTLLPNGDAWLIEASGGKISEPGWPDLSIESAKLRYTHSSLYLNDALLHADEKGRLSVSGTFEFGQSTELQVQLQDVSVTPLLPPDWRLRLAGRLGGSGKVHASSDGSAVRYEADLRLAEGRLEALPLLDQIATFTRTERFRRLNLTQASFSIAHNGSSLVVSNLVLESDGLLRVEGGCTISNGQIDGSFQVGVTASSLQWLPGSQARVFTTSRNGYLWTPVHLSGPADHPTEDLTARLIAVAAGELLQNSQDTLRDTVKGVLDLIPH